MEKGLPLRIGSKTILYSAFDHVDGVGNRLIFVRRWVVISFKLAMAFLNLRSECSYSLQATCFVSEAWLRLVSLFKRL